MLSSTFPATERFHEVRSLTEALAEPLSAEDQTVQSMPDVSPTKWHRAHVTWFFETFVLERFAPDFEPFEPLFRELFNSYYEGVGPQFTRAARGLITRPGAAEVGKYRAHVDAAVESLLDRADDPALLDLIELGCHHEQQHQELLLMDAKHVLSINPLRPVYRPDTPLPGVVEDRTGWVEFAPVGPVEIGTDFGDGTDFGGSPDTPDGSFSFDNEGPRHRVWLEPYALADRLVTAGEWQAFIDDGGYERPELWLSDGWHTVKREGWNAPLYWLRDDDRSSGPGWLVHTLGGTRPVAPHEPVCHVSHYEADAYARWVSLTEPGVRLPTEAEWEHAATTGRVAEPRPFDLDALQPRPADPAGDGQLRQLFGECWQWTASSYLAYPGFAPAAGAVGEYNGKFMSGQMVLRGSSSFTPPGHARATYRNFFPPHCRWMVSGVRLAR